MNVRLPAALSASGKSGSIDIEIPSGGTLSGLLDEIDKKYPGARQKIVDGEGNLYRYVNVYVNGDDVRRQGDGLRTALSETDEVIILPAISGGA